MEGGDRSLPGGRNASRNASFCCACSCAKRSWLRLRLVHHAHLQVVGDEAAVDVDLAKLILNDCNLLSVPVFKKRVRLRNSFKSTTKYCFALLAHCHSMPSVTFKIYRELISRRDTAPYDAAAGPGRRKPLVQDVVDEGGLSSAEEAGDDGHGGLLAVGDHAVIVVLGVVSLGIVRVSPHHLQVQTQVISIYHHLEGMGGDAL